MPCIFRCIDSSAILNTMDLEKHFLKTGDA